MKLFLFFSIAFCFVQAAFSYSVLFKSGKKMEGTLLAEDAATIQIKDSSGVVLSLKKELLDLDAMKKMNPATAAAAPTTRVTTVEWPQPRSAAQAARDAQKKMTGNARLLTKDDLAKTPEISIIGETQTAPGQSAETKPEAVPAKPAEPAPVKDESYWRAEALKLRDRRAEADDKCTAFLYAVEKGDTTLPENTCGRLTDIKKQIEEFEERARRAGIPWGWVDEGRSQ